MPFLEARSTKQLALAAVAVGLKPSHIKAYALRVRDFYEDETFFNKRALAGRGQAAKFISSF
jgi:hypothetical protein